MNSGPFEVGLLEAYDHICHLMKLQHLMAPSRGHKRSERNAAKAAAAVEEEEEEEADLEEEEEEVERMADPDGDGPDIEAEAAPQQLPTASSYEDVWQSAVNSLPNRNAVAGLCMSMGVATSARNRLLLEAPLVAALNGRCDWSAIHVMNAIVPELEGQLQAEAARLAAEAQRAAEISDLRTALQLYFNQYRRARVRAESPPPSPISCD